MSSLGMTCGVSHRWRVPCHPSAMSGSTAFTAGSAPDRTGPAASLSGFCKPRPAGFTLKDTGSGMKHQVCALGISEL